VRTIVPAKPTDTKVFRSKLKKEYPVTTPENKAAEKEIKDLNTAIVEAISTAVAKAAEPAPWYKNRYFIGGLAAVGGAIIGGVAVAAKKKQDNLSLTHTPM
jgi:hypothetical protein